MNKKTVALIMLVIMTLTISSCGGKSKKQKVDTEVDLTQSQTEGTTENDVIEEDATDTESDETDVVDFLFPQQGIRPVAVMIDNEGTKSLPQGGLDQAQLIYEVIVEGGETRLMPVFWGANPSMIGPVRSSRHYFLDYSMEHDAIYVHFGWSPQAIKDISQLKINNINGVAAGGEIFWDITKDKNNWQDSYTSMEKIWGYVNKVKYRTDTEKELVFSYTRTDTDIHEGEKAEDINIRYSQAYTCGYTYDAAAKTYKRIRKGQPQMERVSGNQLEAKNIIIQYVSNSTIKGDKEGRQELGTVGKGEGFFITCGKAVKIKWSKPSRSAATKFTDEKGNDIILNPGQTWIQIVPLSGKVSLE